MTSGDDKGDARDSGGPRIRKPGRLGAISGEISDRWYEVKHVNRSSAETRACGMGESVAMHGVRSAAQGPPKPRPLEGEYPCKCCCGRWLSSPLLRGNLAITSSAEQKGGEGKTKKATTRPCLVSLSLSLRTHTHTLHTRHHSF